MRRRIEVLLLVLSTVACNHPKQKEAPVGTSPPAEAGFSTSDWEDLTGALMESGREGDIEGFKSHLAPDTVRMMEESWAVLFAKIDVGLASPTLDPDDRIRLEQLKTACSWEGLSRNYRPGRLLTITPEKDGSYLVKEILPAGRKVEYFVTRGPGGWQVLYEQDSRWFRQLEALAHAGVNTVLERNGIQAPAPAAGPAEPAGATEP